MRVGGVFTIWRISCWCAAGVFWRSVCVCRCVCPLVTTWQVTVKVHSNSWRAGRKTDTPIHISLAQTASAGKWAVRMCRDLTAWKKKIIKHIPWSSLPWCEPRSGIDTVNLCALLRYSRAFSASHVWSDLCVSAAVCLADSGGSPTAETHRNKGALVLFSSDHMISQ